MGILEFALRHLGTGVDAVDGAFAGNIRVGQLAALPAAAFQVMDADLMRVTGVEVQGAVAAENLQGDLVADAGSQCAWIRYGRWCHS